jgi:hypothetical protein
MSGLRPYTFMDVRSNTRDDSPRDGVPPTNSLNVGGRLTADQYDSVPRNRSLLSLEHDGAMVHQRPGASEVNLVRTDQDMARVKGQITRLKMNQLRRSESSIADTGKLIAARSRLTGSPYPWNVGGSPSPLVLATKEDAQQKNFVGGWRGRQPRPYLGEDAIHGERDYCVGSPDLATFVAFSTEYPWA